ncbi:hypothetical protein PUNSTDRAFT_122133 [Punctularia strigosozonata HHB-11173 SS5]|uniref:uncharacterized protein n=1 Tax=Punctularia strigosozonata (strain HHB-11173) TaxID=741275 RepID=UPI0004417120|nr:uncharacterized protein PUNSTDRAFT_122133 [Punctularia strigosozonata HHB-11173 SS5]EIN06341.1 hypothetical protein PUNSTDRAFT_122133 [Punctularia strigosozonata HHB-11173 SS5]
MTLDSQHLPSTPDNASITASNTVVSGTDNPASTRSSWLKSPENEPGPDYTTWEDLAGPLPEWWEKRLTKAGRVYFVDHKNQITTWDDPRAMRIAEGQRARSKSHEM